jgi:hypothetical protein
MINIRENPKTFVGMMHSIPDLNKRPKKIVNLGGFCKSSQPKQNNPSLHVFWGDSSICA